jgi:hypothetical protein
VTVSLDPRAAEVRKILESRTFRDTEALKRLFDYLAQQALNNKGSDLKEYTVGIEAFGKPEDYDPQTDSSVRVQTGKLRQKLDAYYRTEGIEDDFIIELPKGHFNLEFRRRHPATVVEAPKEALKNRFPWLWIASGVFLLLFALVSVLYVTRHRRPGPGTAWTPEMQEFWGPFLASPRPVMVALGTPLFVKVGTSTFFRDTTLNDWDSASKSDQVRNVERMTGAAHSSPSFNYTPIGEAEGAFQLERLLLPRGHDLLLEASSDLTWEDISRYNMIFLGPPKYIPQTLDLPIPQDFEILHHRVHNLRPAPGESQFFEDRWNSDRTNLEEGHALISRLPGLHGSGEILVLAGSSTESTRAAVEFVTRPEYVASLVRQMHERGGIPQWFQVVIHVRFKSKTPIAIELVTMHALK